MGYGTAIASVAGGVMKMSAANKQAKAGEDAANLSEEQMRKQEEAMRNSITQWEDQMGYAKMFQKSMQELGQQYGDFASTMMQDWEDTFGGFEQNLVSYYEDLDPTKFSTQMKADIGQQMQKANEQFNQAAAQSGIYTSGMKLQNERDNQFKQAEAFAQADIQAPEMVNQMKQGFYGQFGAPQKAAAQNMMSNSYAQQGLFNNMGYNALGNATQGLSNAYGQLGTMFGNNAKTYAGSAAGYGSASGKNMGSGLNLVGSGLTDLFGNFNSGSGNIPTSDTDWCC